jgi:hypothetical protein
MLNDWAKTAAGIPIIKEIPIRSLASFGIAKILMID